RCYRDPRRETLSPCLTSRVGGLTMRRAYEYAPRSRQDGLFPSVQQRVADYFDAQETIDFYRDFWDREHYHFGYYQLGMNPLNLASVTDAMTRQVIARLGVGHQVPADGTILDLGCGIGGTARMLARAYPQIKVIGVTISARQAEIAQAR